MDSGHRGAHRIHATRGEVSLHFNVLTLFPEFFTGFWQTSLVGRALRLGLIRYTMVDLRRFGEGRYRKADDYGFGGGHGMILRYDVLERAYASLSHEDALNITSPQPDKSKNPVPQKNPVPHRQDTFTLSPSPRGQRLTQSLVRGLLKDLQEKEHSITLVCGHYEGLDQRFINKHVDMEYSVGDYILGGGETAALVLMDSLIRLQKGVVRNPISLEEESFESGVLEHDQYTRPDSPEIPRVLLSGHHQKILAWQQKNRLIRTYERRPDLFRKLALTAEDAAMIREYLYERHSGVEQDNDGA